MNANRRKRISKLWDSLEELKEELSLILEEEQEAFDNFPESLQESEKGEAMQNAIEQLEYAESGLQEVMDNLEEAMQ